MGSQIIEPFDEIIEPNYSENILDTPKTQKKLIFFSISLVIICLIIGIIVGGNSLKLYQDVDGYCVESLTGVSKQVCEEKTSIYTMNETGVCHKNSDHGSLTKTECMDICTKTCLNTGGVPPVCSLQCGMKKVNIYHIQTNLYLNVVDNKAVLGKLDPVTSTFFLEPGFVYNGSANTLNYSIIRIRNGNRYMSSLPGENDEVVFVDQFDNTNMAFHYNTQRLFVNNFNIVSSSRNNIVCYNKGKLTIKSVKLPTTVGATWGLQMI